MLANTVINAVIYIPTSPKLLFLLTIFITSDNWKSSRNVQYLNSMEHREIECGKNQRNVFVRHNVRKRNVQ